MKAFTDAFFTAVGFFIGAIIVLYTFGYIYNGLERFFLSQNCERYFEILKEQNLAPHRCYKTEDSQ